MRKPRAETVFAAAVLAAGLILRLLYLVSFAELPVFDFPAGPDVSEYWRLSTAFLVGSSVPPEELIHAPLYPVFRAAAMISAWLNAACHVFASAGAFSLSWPWVTRV